MSSGTPSTPEGGESVLKLADLKRAFKEIMDAPPSPSAPHHPKCDLVHGRGFCNCPTAEFERQVRGV